ncbi:MAG: hypothetical protein ABI780_12055, partial [Ardenticatenales bacterium]
LAPPTVTLRRSAGDRWAIVVMAALLVVPALGLVVGTVAVARTSAGLAIFLGATAAFVSGLAYVVVNEARVRWTTRIALEPDGLHLTLPARRGYVRQAPVRAVVPWPSVAGVETRSEAFRAIGTTVLQQAYALRLADGGRIVLGADRRMVDPFFAGAAEAIAARARTTLVDRGMVDGDPGFLMIRGQAVPEWDASPLAPAAAATRTRQERRAWQLVGWAVLLTLAARALAALLG